MVTERKDKINLICGAVINSILYHLKLVAYFNLENRKSSYFDQPERNVLTVRQKSPYAGDSGILLAKY